MMEKLKDTPQHLPELPPIFKTWNQMYLALLGWQAFLIALFYSFMKYFG